MTAFLQAIQRFFSWWGGELKAFLPARFRQPEKLRSRRLRLMVDDQSSKLYYEDEGEQSLLAQTSMATKAAGNSEPDRLQPLRSALAKLPAQRLDVEVQAPRAQALVRPLRFPQAAAENLRDVLGFEMARYTPFASHDVLFDYRLDATQADPERVGLSLVVLPLRGFAAVWDLLREWSALEPVSQSVQVDAAYVHYRLRSRSANAKGRRLKWLLIALNLALLGGLLWVPYSAQREQLAQLDAQIAVVKRQAEVTSILQRRVDAAREAIGDIVDEVEGRVPRVELLEEISARLPDHTWVFRLEMRQRRVKLQGSSAEASALIAILEKSPMLTDVRFDSPVTRESNSSRDRFQISAKLRQAVPAEAGS